MGHRPAPPAAPLGNVWARTVPHHALPKSSQRNVFSCGAVLEIPGVTTPTQWCGTTLLFPETAGRPLIGMADRELAYQQPDRDTPENRDPAALLAEGHCRLPAHGPRQLLPDPSPSPGGTASHWGVRQGGEGGVPTPLEVT